MMELDLHKCCYIILMFQVLANDKSLRLVAAGIKLHI